jgi:hypothetical protein
MDPLTEEESVVLRDVVDIAIDGFEDAKQRVEKEPFDSWEGLLEETGSYEETLGHLKSIRRKV